MKLRRLVGAAALTIALAVPLSPPAPAQAEPATTHASATTPGLVEMSTAKYKFKNCTAMNRVYPHGVGKKGAKDHTSGRPVTNFKKNTALYKKIINFRSGLDRDKDGIACEKR
ncbi:MAG TPA: excalibur calcium-binding domain-containing protein [Propionicimonas sp.]